MKTRYCAICGAGTKKASRRLTCSWTCHSLLRKLSVKRRSRRYSIKLFNNCVRCSRLYYQVSFLQKLCEACHGEVRPLKNYQNKLMIAAKLGNKFPLPPSDECNQCGKKIARVWSRRCHACSLIMDEKSKQAHYKKRKKEKLLIRSIKNFYTLQSLTNEMKKHEK